MKLLSAALALLCAAPALAQEIPIESYWQAADGNDYAPAILRAQEALPLYQSLKLTFAKKEYRCLSKVHIIRPAVALIGKASGAYGTVNAHTNGVNVPTLYFPDTSGDVGIEVHYPGSYGPDATARGDNFLIENLAIVGPGATTGTIDDDGIHIHFGGVVRNVFIRYFRGYGIRNRCGASNTVLENLGNCNGSKFDRVRIYNTGNAGLYFSGGDANQNRMYEVSTNDCGDDMANRTVSTTAVTCTSQSCAISYSGGSNSFDLDDVVTLTNTTYTFTRGVVTATTASTITVNAAYDDDNGASGIPNGAMADGTGTLTGRRVQMMDSSLIGNLYVSSSANGSSSGDGFWAYGNCDSLYLMCYTEGSLASMITPPSMIWGGRMNPQTGFTSYLDGSTNGMMIAQPQIRASYDNMGSVSDEVYGAIGSVDNRDSAFEWEHDSAAYAWRLQKAHTPQGSGKWEIVGNNSNSLVPLRWGDSTDVREGPAYPQIGMGDLFLGSNIATPNTTVNRGVLGFRVNAGRSVRLEAHVSAQISGITTATPPVVTLATDHNLTPSSAGHRCLIRNVAGITPVNGDVRCTAHASSANVMTLQDVSGANLVGAGTYTSGTGLALVVRYVGTSSVVPTRGDWAVGDTLYRDPPAVGQPIGWICTVTGTPGTWVAMANL